MIPLTFSREKHWLRKIHILQEHGTHSYKILQVNALTWQVFRTILTFLQDFRQLAIFLQDLTEDILLNFEKLDKHEKRF